MKFNVYFGICIRLILLFTVAISGTYIPEILPPTFFGDQIESTSRGQIEHWGPRHVWYVCMMVCLFLLSLINLIMSIRNLITSNYEVSSLNQ